MDGHPRNKSVTVTQWQPRSTWGQGGSGTNYDSVRRAVYCVKLYFKWINDAAVIQNSIPTRFV